MDLLIFAKTHWMDTVDANGQTGHERVLLRMESDKADQKSLDEYLKKHSARYRPGDIIEVRPDGYYALHGFNKNAFEVVTRPGVSVDESLIEADWNMGADGIAVIHRRRRYSVPAAAVVKGATREAKTDAELGLIDQQVVRLAVTRG